MNLFLNANQAFEQMILKLYIDPQYETSPRGQKIKELTNVSLIIENSYDNIVYNPIRKISTKYLVAEFLWYLLGKQDKEGSDFIVKYAKFWDSLRNADGSLNSNYGYYIFNPMNSIYKVNNSNDFYSNKSQFDYVVSTLTKDKDSRQAIININSIFHKSIENIKDFPCTTTMHFMIRNNKLNLTVHMRSCDIVLGFCNDVFQFTEIQKLLYFNLKNTYKDLKLGSYTLLANSLHLYERHFDMGKNISFYIPNLSEAHFDKANSSYTREEAINVLLNNEKTKNPHLVWMKEQLGDLK